MTRGLTRRGMHRVFASLTLALGLVCAFFVAQWWAARQLQDDMHAAAQAPAAAPPASAVLPGEDVRVTLARAARLRELGLADDGIRLLQAVVASPKVAPEARQVALFNLGNALMALAASSGAAGDGDRARVLLELAKQRYRDLLRTAPDDWDARLNLEHALRVAPEGEVPVPPEAPKNVQKINIDDNVVRPVELP